MCSKRRWAESGSIYHESVEAAMKYSTASCTGSLFGYSWQSASQSVSLCSPCSLGGLHSHNARSEIFSSHPQQSLLLSRGKQLLDFSKISGCPLVLRVKVFLSSEYFILVYSGGLSKISYLIPYLWFFCVAVVVVWQWTKCFVMCKRRCCHVSHT